MIADGRPFDRAAGSGNGSRGRGSWSWRRATATACLWHHSRGMTRCLVTGPLRLRSQASPPSFTVRPR